MSRTPVIASLALGAAVLTAFGLSDRSSAQSDQGQISNEPVLIELFTSQGCSSCPPADRLAARMDAQEDLVIISRPVDYWDRLGWKDTLASPANTALQRAYARRGLNGYNGVYTPQTVVAGSFGEVGSDERALRRQIRSAQQAKNSADLSIEATTDGGFQARLSGQVAAAAEVALMAVSRREDIAIGRGENRGRTIRYTNALIAERKLATWRGGASAVVVKPSDLAIKGADRFALVVREPAGGAVLAARWLD